MFLAALLQASVLVQPLYLTEAPPELRSVRSLRLLHRDAVGCPQDISRTRDETLALAHDLVLRLRSGVAFDRIADEYALPADRTDAQLLGTYTPGVLAGEFDRFLFAADVGAISEPIATSAGVHLLQRVETWAGVRQIFVRGSDGDARARCTSVVEQLRGGADFATMAREHSEDPDSRARDGQLAIYERGRRDTLLKGEAFRMEVGEIRGPLESPLGLHILQRVPLDALDPKLAESNFIRIRAIVIGFDTAVGADPLKSPTQARAKEIAEDVERRLQSGADMRKLARELTDEPGGKEREGDLGWLHRYAPNIPDPLRRAFLMRPGETSEPISTSFGYLIARRER